jgi:hypothetical protein
MSIEAARTEGEAAAEALLQAVAEFNTRLSTRITAIASGIETDAALAASFPAPRISPA